MVGRNCWVTTIPRTKTSQRLAAAWEIITWIRSHRNRRTQARITTMKKRNLNLHHTKESNFQKPVWEWVPFIRSVTLNTCNEGDCTCFTGYPTMLTRKGHLFCRGNHLGMWRALSPEYHGDHSWGNEHGSPMEIIPIDTEEERRHGWREFTYF